MATSYRATLKGNTLEWQKDAPTVSGELEVEVVIFKPQHAEAEQGRRMAKALQDIAETAVFEKMDALTWQQEQRQDRFFPNRDE